MPEKAVTIYSASAGAGKTYTLAKKYIEMLLEKHSGENGHRHILAVTFTKKATAEMKERILTNLYELANGYASDFLFEKEDDPNNFVKYCKKIGLEDEDAIRSRAKVVLHELLQDYSMFAVSTIDSFFQQIIRSFAKEIGLHCGYNLEMDSDQVIGKAIDDVFFNLEEGSPIYKWMLEYVSYMLDETGNWNNKDEINSLCKDLINESFQAQVSETVMHYDPEELKAYRTQLKRTIKDFKDKASGLVREGRRIAFSHGLMGKDDVKANTLSPIWSDDVEKKPSPTFYKIASADDLITKTCKNKEDIRSAWDDGLGQIVAQIQDLYNQSYQTYADCKAILSHLNALGTMPAIQAQIETTNKDLHRMPISETNKRLHGIIGSSDTPFIYEKVGQRITHFLLDEFQDTSTLQWANFSPLIKESIASCTDAKAVDLVVGDVKQSIYRWRNSDWRLLYQGIESDIGNRCVKSSLNTNFRSSHDIVNFNNVFFRKYVDYLAENCIRPTDRNTLFDIYSDLEQKAHKTKEAGAVKINFLSKDEYSDETMPHLISAIRDLEERGLAGHLSKVGILIRNRKEAKSIAQALSAAGIGVTSKEGLKIINSSSVKLLIAQLQVFNSPQNKKVLFDRNHAYAIFKNLSNEERLHLLITEPEEALRELDEKMVGFKNLPLYQMVQDVAITLGLYSKGHEADQGYLQAFMDEVYKYCSNRDADLYSFLDWWKEHSEKLFIPTPDEENSIQMMTIHNSKGLEFDAVIIPNCVWELGYNTHIPPTCWCSTKGDKQYGALPYLPITMNSNVSGGFFSTDYQDEEFNQYIDNLNLTYVAFTRPRKELIIFATKQEIKNKATNINQILYHAYGSACVNDKYAEGTLKKDEDGKPTFVADFVYEEKAEETYKNGKPIYKRPQAEVVDIKCVKPQYHPISIRAHYEDTDPIKEGKELHDILSRIAVESDLEQALKDALNEGIISEEKVAAKRQEIQDIFNLVRQNGYNWYTEGWEVKNEIEFIKNGTEKVDGQIQDVSGNILRADRVLFGENEIIVIDYKSGRIEQDEHVKQVQEYMSLLKGIYADKHISGYLLYTAKSYIKPVPNK